MLTLCRALANFIMKIEKSQDIILNEFKVVQSSSGHSKQQCVATTVIPNNSAWQQRCKI